MSRRLPLLVATLAGLSTLLPAHASDDATRAVAAAYSEQIMDGMRIGMTMAPDTPDTLKACASGLDDHALAEPLVARVAAYFTAEEISSLQAYMTGEGAARRRAYGIQQAMHALKLRTFPPNPLSDEDRTALEAFKATPLFERSNAFLDALAGDGDLAGRAHQVARVCAPTR